MPRLALVTGANRGIGLEITRQLARKGLHVILTSRDPQKGQAAAAELHRDHPHITYHPLDVTDPQSIKALADHIKTHHTGLDILINNAGIALQGFDAEVARATIEANFFGPLRVTDALLPHLRQQARIVMVSSGLGDRGRLSGPAAQSFAHPETMTRDETIALMRKFIDDVAAGTHTKAGWPSSAYSVSKIGLNALTAAIGRELAQDDRGILCNAVCPVWVRTDMGGPSAPRSVEQGAETPVWLALLPSDGPQGGVFRDKAPAPW